MSSESSSSRRLAAILFADISGYTAIMQKDENAAAILRRKFQQELESKVPKGNGEIVNFYGDGAFCIFQNPLEAMKCAIALQSEFRNDPKVPVRIGIHSGTVVFEGNQAYGDNVNIAARIESMGIPGAILVSKKVRDELKNQPDILLPSLGKFEFKNVEEPMEVFALANEGFVVPEKSQIQGKLKTSKTPVQWKPIAGILGALALIFLIYTQFSKNSGSGNNPQVLQAAIPNNSLAVLPFANMSSDKENEYFTDGIHDDLITHVSKIGSMRVISKSSVQQYKETKPSNSEIAQILGVAHIMEGSVRRSGDQVRINVQLIEAETEQNIWSEIYDRKLTTENIFEIQSEIASAIAKALNTQITSSQQIALSQRPTENLEAYEAYLKGRQLIDQRTPSSITESQSFFEKAIELDPEFALAHVSLGEVHYLLVEYALIDPSINFPLAWKSLANANRLNSNLAEAYALEMTLHHYDTGNIEAAGKAYKKAIEINPNYGDAHFWFAHAVLSIERNAIKALSIIQKAVEVNPLSPKFLNMQGWIQRNAGLTSESTNSFKKAIELSPDYVIPARNLQANYIYKGYMDSAAIVIHNELKNNSNDGDYVNEYFISLGNLGMVEELKQELQEFSPQSSKDSLIQTFGQMNLAFSNGDFERMQAITGQISEFLREQNPLLLFGTYFYARDYDNAIKEYEKIFPPPIQTGYMNNHMRTGYSIKPNLIYTLQEYIYCLSQVGRNDEAQELLIRFYDYIVNHEEFELIEEKNGRDFTLIRDNIMKGEHDLALDQFALFYNGKLNSGWQYILADPIFDVLQDNPRYQEIISDIKRNVTEQRNQFRNYLKGKG